MATTKRPYLPKEQYDQLYFFVDGKFLPRILKGEVDPFQACSNRRYDTIDEARKASLAKSKKNWAEIKVSAYPFHSLDVAIFKGRKYVGSVEYNILRDKKLSIEYDGLWYPAEHPKDPSPILSDGTIGTRKRRN